MSEKSERHDWPLPEGSTTEYAPDEAGGTVNSSGRVNDGWAYVRTAEGSSYVRLPEGGAEKAILAAELPGESEDQQVRLARIAHEYSQRGAGGVRPESIELWEDIVRLKKIPLSHAQIAERLALPMSTFNYHKNKMKQTRYWQDHGLD